MQMGVFFGAYLVIELERKIVFRLKSSFFVPPENTSVERCKFDFSQIKTDLFQIQALL